MKGKRGRPLIPLSKISNRKSSALTSDASQDDQPADIQLATGGAAKKRLDKASRKKAVFTGSDKRGNKK